MGGLRPLIRPIGYAAGVSRIAAQGSLRGALPHTSRIADATFGKAREVFSARDAEEEPRARCAQDLATWNSRHEQRARRPPSAMQVAPAGLALTDW
jgi:hypothetical protein